MFLNAKKYLRLKKLHLNTFFLIENVFFDWSNLFCVWTMLWVGHLCLNYSIPKKLLQSKKHFQSKKKNSLNAKKKKTFDIFVLIIKPKKNCFKKKKKFSIKKKNCLNAKKKKSFEVFFFWLNFLFFWMKWKKFWSRFFFESFWHKRTAVGGCFPIGQTCLSDKCLHQRRLSDKQVMVATRQRARKQWWSCW